MAARGYSLVLLLGLLISTGVGAATAPVQIALETIDDCARRLNPDVDLGYDRIIARCPTLVRHLDESGLSVWLPTDWERPGNDLSAGGLRELHELLTREVRVTASVGARTPRVTHVREVLASLTRVDDAHSGWWARTRAWFRHVFASQRAAADEDWLDRMIGQSGVSQTVIELVSYATLALVVVLALVIVANELRVGGVWGGGGLRRWLVARGAMAGGAMTSGTEAGGTLSGWEDVLEAPVAGRLGVLLDLVVARLNEVGGARLSRGLTVRELVSAAPLADEGDRVRLAELARASERVRFSGVEVSEAAVAEVVEKGRVLLERIERGAGATAGGSGSGVGGDTSRVAGSGT